MSKARSKHRYLIKTGRAMCKKPRRLSRFLFGTENDHVVGWIRCNLSVIRSFQHLLQVRIDWLTRRFMSQKGKAKSRKLTAHCLLSHPGLHFLGWPCDQGSNKKEYWGHVQLAYDINSWAMTKWASGRMYTSRNNWKNCIYRTVLPSRIRKHC